MQTRVYTVRLWLVLGIALTAALAWWMRAWILQTAGQLLWGMTLALAALPIARRMESRLSPGAAAALGIAAVMIAALGVLWVAAPPLIRQGRQLGAMLPTLYEPVERLVQRLQTLFARSALTVNGQWQHALWERGQEMLASALPAIGGWLRNVAGGMGRWMLTPVFGFYFLRDRKRISQWLISLLPLCARMLTVRMVREMRRETAGYLRGQLMACGAVGALTAAGLLLCGVPAWLALGALMGVLEFIPYAGPVIGGGLAVLCALPGGWTKTLWTLGVVLAVQQLEGTVLSPKFMSEATRLHPLAVVACVTFGGAAAGLTGVLAAVPLLLCIRAALRVWSLRRFDQ